MSKKKNKKISRMIQAINRKEAISQGAYDGRYKKKVFIDKKKEAKKKGDL